MAWPRDDARAQESAERFLIELPGWTGSSPAITDQKERKSVRVSRDYLRGDARIHALLVSAINTGRGPLYLVVKEGHLRTETIDGFQMEIYSASGFVMITIDLSANTTLRLIFEKVAEDEAMTIARKFDWKGIQAALN